MSAKILYLCPLLKKPSSSLQTSFMDDPYEKFNWFLGFNIN